MLNKMLMLAFMFCMLLGALAPTCSLLARDEVPSVANLSSVRYCTLVPCVLGLVHLMFRGGLV